MLEDAIGVPKKLNNFPSRVLILVVLEDAIGVCEQARTSAEGNVLILVVLEDVIGDGRLLQTREGCAESLNPCCAGRCYRRVNSEGETFHSRSLNPCCAGRCYRRSGFKSQNPDSVLS